MSSISENIYIKEFKANPCVICKTSLKKDIKFINCLYCKKLSICDICFNVFIYPRIHNTKILDSRHNPCNIIFPCDNQDETTYWNITNSILQNKCLECNATDAIEYFFQPKKNTSLLIKTRYYNQYEQIQKLQEIYKFMFHEINPTMGYHVQLNTNPLTLESYYTFQTTQIDTPLYRDCSIQKDDTKQKIDYFIVENIIFKHKINTAYDIIAFTHELDILCLHDLKEMILRSSIGYIIEFILLQENTSFNFELLSTKMNKLITSYYSNELYLQILKLNCPYCFTSYNLNHDGISSQYITKRKYFCDNISTGRYEFPCFSCRKTLNYSFINSSDHLWTIYDMFFKNMSSENIHALYFHDAFYNNTYDITNNSKMAFWFIVKRLEFFYHIIWARHLNATFHMIHEHDCFHLIFSNPKYLTFFEWLVLGFIGDFLTLEMDPFCIVYKKDPPFKLSIAHADNVLYSLHIPNKKITVLDLQNFKQSVLFAKFISKFNN